MHQGAILHSLQGKYENLFCVLHQYMFANSARISFFLRAIDTKCKSAYKYDVKYRKC